jgi:hypothetical protein
MSNPETLVQEIPTPKLMTARTCQMSGSQGKADGLKLHKILRKTTNPSSLRSKKCPKSLTRAQE